MQPATDVNRSSKEIASNADHKQLRKESDTYLTTRLSLRYSHEQQFNQSIVHLRAHFPNTNWRTKILSLERQSDRIIIKSWYVTYVDIREDVHKG